MTINIAQGVQAYANAARNLAQPGADAASATPGGGFGDMLKSAMQDSLSTEKQGEAATMQAVAGKADINSVVAAVNNADMTLQTVVAVRDKVVSAYQEILHMSI